MLNIEDFHKEDNDVLFYEGENHYYIKYDEDDYCYCLTVFSLTDDRNDIITESYACSSLSVSIASIEALENGEEI